MYCYNHKLENMINIREKRCLHEDCDKYPNYNLPGKPARYCREHKTLQMIDVKHKKCKTHLCDTIVSKKYDGYCFYCFIHTYPDHEISRNYKNKEKTVVEEIKTHFPSLSWIHDCVINDGCSMRRLDLFVDLGYQVIIIEVDENQHKLYDTTIENKRIMELSKDIGHRPLIFIRFNPDSYYKDKVKIPSCWGFNKNGLCVIQNKDNWNERIKILRKCIEYWINPKNKSEKIIHIEQLFYDDTDMSELYYEEEYNSEEDDDENSKEVDEDDNSEEDEELEFDFEEEEIEYNDEGILIV